MKKYRVLAREVAYEGHFVLERYRLRHTLFEGGWSEAIVRELLSPGRAAAVLPYDPASDRVLLIEQFRIGAIHDVQPPWLLEVVAGMVEGVETAQQLARREAREEAGCELQALRRIADYLPSPGCSSERCVLFCGKADLAAAGGVHGLAEEDENILVHVLSAAQAIELCEQGSIRNAATIIALQWLALQRLRGGVRFD